MLINREFCTAAMSAISFLAGFLLISLNHFDVCSMYRLVIRFP